MRRKHHLSPNTATLLAVRVHDVSESMSPEAPDSPRATSQALRSWEWWAFFTSLSARIFSKARVRNMFFVFFPSYMSRRISERGVARPQSRGSRWGGGRLQPPRLETLFLQKCQPPSPALANINKYRRWGKSLSSPLTTCLLRHVGERKRRHVGLKTTAAGRGGETPHPTPSTTTTTTATAHIHLYPYLTPTKKNVVIFRCDRYSTVFRF